VLAAAVERLARLARAAVAAEGCIAAALQAYTLRAVSAVE